MRKVGIPSSGVQRVNDTFIQVLVQLFVIGLVPVGVRSFYGSVMNGLVDIYTGVSAAVCYWFSSCRRA